MRPPYYPFLEERAILGVIDAREEREVPVGVGEGHDDELNLRNQSYMRFSLDV